MSPTVRVSSGQAAVSTKCSPPGGSLLRERAMHGDSEGLSSGNSSAGTGWVASGECLVWASVSLPELGMCHPQLRLCLC